MRKDLYTEENYALICTNRLSVTMTIMSVHCDKIAE